MIQEIVLPFDTEWAPVVLLHAGELTCFYESGKIRYIRHGATEIVRMLYASVRDGHWATLPCTIADERIDIGPDCFSIQYTALYHADGIVYTALVSIQGNADNSILFSMKGAALQAFQKNRIGICIHHPVKECCGQRVTVERPDGSSYQAVFPEMVSPQQPMLDIQQMEWATTDGALVEIAFEGDTFETEDQRNWSDSSYKTYSTPLQIPFPVRMAPGDTMAQQIKITVVKNIQTQESPPTPINEEKIAFPAIGYSRSAIQPPLSTAEILFLQKIPFHHYRVVLTMDDKSWAATLQTSLTEAAQLKTRLELVVFFSDQIMDELATLLSLLLPAPQLLYSLLVLQKGIPASPAQLMTRAYNAIKKVLPLVQAGYGTNANFVDVNRQRPPAEALFDFVSYGLYPQAHMTDNRSILENLDNQPDMIATASNFAPGKNIFVSPVTINDRSAPAADERQYSSFAACWLLMTLQQLAMAGSITYFELFGEAGLLRLNKNEKGQTISIQPSIAYEMLVRIKAFQPKWVIKKYAGNSVSMEGLLLENAQAEQLFFKAPQAVANFRNEYQPG